jgi:outer membrane protein insertion porin family
LPLRAEEPAPPLIVRDVALQGTRHVQEAVVLRRIGTRAGSPFDAARVTEDIRAIFALGFFDDVQVRVEEFEGGIKLIFVVVERPFVRDVAFEGNRRVSTRTLGDSAALSLGSIYDRVEVQRARRRLEDRYEQEGYFEARIEPAAERLPDGDVRVVFRIDEGRRFTIDRIVIEGEQGLSERRIKSVMQTRERRLLVRRGIAHRGDLEADMERILALYRDEGYLQARVEGHEISVDRERGWVAVTIRVVEGPQFRVGRVDVTGTSVLPAEEVRRQIRLAPGQVFSRSALHESMQAISALYDRAGRACAEVTVTMEIREGSRVHVQRVRSPARC